MRSEREWAALEALLQHASDALTFVDGMSEEAFREDRLTFLAVTRCLEVVSEASRRLSDATRDAHPHLPWRQIRDAGNVYRHGYDSVLPEAVWQTVTRSLPPLVTFAEAELAKRV